MAPPPYLLTFSMPLFSKNNKTCWIFDKHSISLFIDFFIFLKKRHNIIEHIDEIEIGGGILIFVWISHRVRWKEIIQMTMTSFVFGLSLTKIKDWKKNEVNGYSAAWNDVQNNHLARIIVQKNVFNNSKSIVYKF